MSSPNWVPLPKGPRAQRAHLYVGSLAFHVWADGPSRSGWNWSMVVRREGDILEMGDATSEEDAKTKAEDAGRRLALALVQALRVSL